MGMVLNQSWLSECRRDIFDKPWDYIPDIPETDTFFWDEETMLFWDEYGEYVEPFDILTPNEFYIFRARCEDMWVLRVNEAPWEPELYSIALVHPENLAV